METKISELEKLEEYIISYKAEKDAKKKHILYLNLVYESLKLVKKIVSGMCSIPVNILRDDMVQVGALGMLKAIESYVPVEKGSFKTYATKFIRGKMVLKPPRV